MVDDLLAMLRRPYGNPTFAEKQEIADRIEELKFTIVKEAKSHEKELAVWAENYAAIERKLASMTAERDAAITRAYAMGLEDAGPICTGKKDVNGKSINLGDIVQHHNERKNTKPEYWNPIYEVTWNAPCFQLRHVGGGKSGGDMTFTLRYYPQDLEVIKAARALTTPADLVERVLKGDKS